MAETFAYLFGRTASASAPVEGARRQLLSFAAVRRTLETWEEREYVRSRLRDMLMTAPHLIDDIGLTRKQVEVEIVKPFWRD